MRGRGSGDWFGSGAGGWSVAKIVLGRGMVHTRWPSSALCKPTIPRPSRMWWVRRLMLTALDSPHWIRNGGRIGDPYAGPHRAAEEAARLPVGPIAGKAD